MHKLQHSVDLILLVSPVGGFVVETISGDTVTDRLFVGLSRRNGCSRTGTTRTLFHDCPDNTYAARFEVGIQDLSGLEVRFN